MDNPQVVSDPVGRQVHFCCGFQLVGELLEALKSIPEENLVSGIHSLYSVLKTKLYFKPISDSLSDLPDICGLKPGRRSC